MAGDWLHCDEKLHARFSYRRFHKVSVAQRKDDTRRLVYRNAWPGINGIVMKTVMHALFLESFRRLAQPRARMMRAGLCIAMYGVAEG